MNLQTVPRRELRKKEIDPEVRRVALRTAFIARFIVLREGRRSKAHRVIEGMDWEEGCTAYQLYDRIREAFVLNGDRLGPVDRDLRRALEHAEKSVDYFLQPYVDRATVTFKDALADYKRSNRLLFGSDGEIPRTGGWRC